MSHALNYGNSLAKDFGKAPKPLGYHKEILEIFIFLKPETKRQNLRFTQCFHFVQLHQEQKEKLIY